MARRIQVWIVLILSVVAGCSVPEDRESVGLRFRPEIGRKRTFHVTWRVATSYRRSSGQECTEHLRTWVVEVEPVAIADDQSVSARVGIRQLQEESARYVNGEKDPLWKFDSAARGHQYKRTLGPNIGFQGETFPATFSAESRLVEMDTDDFYTAVAENRARHEDDAVLLGLAIAHDVQATLGQVDLSPEQTALLYRLERAEAKEAIEKTDAEYGSRQKRLQAYERAASTSQLGGTTTLRRLLEYIAAPLTDGPVKPGVCWKAPVVIYLEGPTEMVGTHTVLEIKDDVCTIQVEAKRTLADEPQAETGRPAMSESIRGTYLATLTVDQTSGWLVARKAVMNLIGTVQSPGPATNEPRPRIPVTIEASVTVEAE